MHVFPRLKENIQKFQECKHTKLPIISCLQVTSSVLQVHDHSESLKVERLIQFTSPPLRPSSIIRVLIITRLHLQIFPEFPFSIYCAHFTSNPFFNVVHYDQVFEIPFSYTLSWFQLNNTACGSTIRTWPKANRLSFPRYCHPEVKWFGRMHVLGADCHEIVRKLWNCSATLVNNAFGDYRKNANAIRCHHRSDTSFASHLPRDICTYKAGNSIVWPKQSAIQFRH